MDKRALRYLKLAILFNFLDFYIGWLNLLPNFVAMWLFYSYVRSHARQTETEERIKPLLLVLAADFFLHWIWQFENGIEALLIVVIYLYAVYVLIGEVSERVRPHQPEQAHKLDIMRILLVLLHSLAFLAAPYGNEVLNFLIAAANIGMCIVFIKVIWKIRPSCISAG